MSLTPAQLQVVESSYARGQQATGVLRESGQSCGACGAERTIFSERERQIADELVRWFRAGNRDPQTAVQYAAALSEVRALKEELEYRARKGAEAHEMLFSKTEPTAD